MAATVTYDLILTPEQEQRAALVRARLQEKLTAVQYRRVAMLHGLDGGEEMTYRDVRDAEGTRAVSSVHESVDTAMERLRQDVCLLVLWLDMHPVTRTSPETRTYCPLTGGTDG